MNSIASFTETVWFSSAYLIKTLFLRKYIRNCFAYLLLYVFAQHNAVQFEVASDFSILYMVCALS